MTEPAVISKPEFKTAGGGKLKDPASYPSAMYWGERIYFCKAACLRVFEQNPDSFRVGEVEHPIRGEIGNRQLNMNVISSGSSQIGHFDYLD